jgi:hypothetical protein
MNHEQDPSGVSRLVNSRATPTTTELPLNEIHDEWSPHNGETKLGDQDRQK